jgi:hypothetical protein
MNEWIKTQIINQCFMYINKEMTGNDSSTPISQGGKIQNAPCERNYFTLNYYQIIEIVKLCLNNTGKYMMINKNSNLNQIK